MVSALVIAALWLAALALFVAVAYRRRWRGTGPAATDATGDSSEDGAAKTWWDRLEIMAPVMATVVVAALTLSFNAAEGRRAANHRAQLERAAALDSARETSLRDYLAQMSDLILDRGLLRSGAGGEAVRQIARTATLITLSRVDSKRRAVVVKFLTEAGLLRRRDTLVLLKFAGLQYAQLAAADLGAVNLSEANLRGANLRWANLALANLALANLNTADLTGADLTGANLGGAGLTGANLGGANLRGANLRRTNLRRADLSGANLSGANLSRALLESANLTGTSLRGSDVTEADLRGALGVDLAGSHGKPAHAP